jgi:hypothetical protein
MLTSLALLAWQGFDSSAFDRFTEVRIGTGNPVYWSCIGELYTYPEGKLLCRVEGVDTARRVSFEKGKSAIQLNRKVFYYRDAVTGEVLSKVPRIEYDYQRIDYSLSDKKLIATVQQGKGARKQSISADGAKYKRLGSTNFFSIPLFLSIETPRGKMEAYENYEFVDSGKSPYHLTWNRFGDLPPAFGSGKGAMHLVAMRYDSFEKLPESLREYIEKQAPLWKLPPKDLAEIEALSK